MSQKVGVKGIHKGLDYGDMTSDTSDGPRKSKDRRKAKRFAAKRQRSNGRKDIKEQCQ